MKTVAIVQARCGSKRFPRKVLADLNGYPVLEHVLSRVLAIRGIDTVCLAVPDEIASDELEVVAENTATRAGKKITIVRGSENDVLARYVKAARRTKADLIMRITSDCPLIDPTVCYEVLSLALKSGADYASNVHPRSFEKGLDCEVFTRLLLERAHKAATDPYEREHVTPWIYDNAVNIVNVTRKLDRHLINWSVDTEMDLEVVRRELERRYGDD